MVTPNDDRGFQLPLSDHLIKFQASSCAFAVAQPADTCGQTLKLHFVACHADPAVQVFIIREKGLYRRIRAVDIFRITRQRYPTEGSLALTKQRANVGRNKSRIVKRLLYASVKSPLTQVVAIVKYLCPTPLEGQHSFKVLRH
jgi:hypothetical protein